MDQRRKTMRNVGLLIALSTPITAFIAFALAAVAFGEDQLEDGGGTTSLGYAAMALPLVIGLAIAAWAQLGGAVPKQRRVAIGVAAMGLACAVLGLVAVAAAEDASIGGGLLVLFGFALLIVAATLVFVVRRVPPPPTGPAAGS